MRKTLQVILIFLMIILLKPTDTLAQSGIAATLRIGTLGAEIGVVKSLNPRFNVRGGINIFGYTHDGETEPEDPDAYSLKYDADLDFLSFSALVDFMPFENSFRLTAGLLINNNEVAGTGRITESIEVGSNTIYTPDQVGALTVKIEPSSSISPYLGIGFGNPVAIDKKFGFFFDLGIIYQGSPDITLEADENTMIYPTTDASIYDNAKVMEDAIQDIRWYPVITFGLSYQF